MTPTTATEVLPKSAGRHVRKAAAAHSRIRKAVATQSVPSNDDTSDLGAALASLISMCPPNDDTDDTSESDGADLDI